MYAILLQIRHFELRAYGVIMVLAFLAALWLSTKEAQVFSSLLILASLIAFVVLRKPAAGGR